MADQPGYTRMPNALLELLPLLPDAECRVMLVIARKTIGWQKACDVISVRQIRDATGLSLQGTMNGIEAALKRGILKRSPSGFNNGYCYEIDHDQVFHEVEHLKCSTKLSSQPSRTQVFHEVEHKVFHEVEQQKKDLKEKKEKIRAPRKSAGAPAEKTDHQKIMDAYASALAYPIRDGPKEGNAAKWLVNHGYSPEQVTACYAHLKVQAFYAKQHLSLQTVASQIGAYLQAQNGHSNAKLLRSGLNGHSERKPQVEADRDNPF